MRSANSSTLLEFYQAAHLTDAATFLTAGSLQADQSVSDWLVPFSSQYPIHAPMKWLGQQQEQLGAIVPPLPFDCRTCRNTNSASLVGLCADLPEDQIHDSGCNPEKRG